jgi:hypothetical protein
MNVQHGNDNSMTEVDKLFRLSNPVALEDVPEAHSPAGEALYDRVLDRVAREHQDDTELRRRFRATRPWLGRRLVAVGVAATALAIAVAFLPGRLADEGSVDVIERALAAVSAGPVLHTVVENSDWSSTLVELDSGMESVEPLRNEFWYDEKRDRLCLRMTVGDEVLRDVRCGSVRASGVPISQPALGFASRYRAALESGRARVVRRETVDGREAMVLQIAVPAWKDDQGRVVQPRFVEEIAVDGDTFKPLRFRHIPGPEVAEGPTPWWRVLSIESIERDPKDFTAPKRREMRSFGPAGNDQPITSAEAANALGRTALWPGTEVGAAELDRIGVATNRITWTDGGVTESPYLLIRYGPDENPGSRKPWIWLSVGTSAEGTPRFGPADGEAVPAGTVRLTFVEAHDDRSIDMWFGNVQRDGLYINLQSPDRKLVIEAARRLKPIES